MTNEELIAGRKAAFLKRIRSGRNFNAPLREETGIQFDGDDMIGFVISQALEAIYSDEDLDESERKIKLAQVAFVFDFLKGGSLLDIETYMNKNGIKGNSPGWIYEVATDGVRHIRQNREQLHELSTRNKVEHHPIDELRVQIDALVESGRLTNEDTGQLMLLLGLQHSQRTREAHLAALKAIRLKLRRDIQEAGTDTFRTPQQIQGKEFLRFLVTPIAGRVLYGNARYASIDQLIAHLENSSASRDSAARPPRQVVQDDVYACISSALAKLYP